VILFKIYFVKAKDKGTFNFKR